MKIKFWSLLDVFTRIDCIFNSTYDINLETSPRLFLNILLFALFDPLNMQCGWIYIKIVLVSNRSKYFKCIKYQDQCIVKLLFKLTHIFEKQCFLKKRLELVLRPILYLEMKLK